ncbi:hypothetical protein ABZ832_19030 [Streptantibioticus parmotrematis]|uniref:hypothetical protein n=1 Tax=Streptantibioticus parmotrematis TaxID=2873249 RepID=UPI0033ED5832
MFLLAAAFRVMLVCTIPVDALPPTNILLRLAMLGFLNGFHNGYGTRNGLKV